MPLFKIDTKSLSTVEQTDFALEKDLQTLIEANLGPVFNCRFVASEFSTGAQHAGRIDTLAISEENNPVIIEYKKVVSSELINQSLFYLSWIQDHRGDFEIAAQKALGGNIEVDWSDVRVMCIAPNYKKYDLHAVQMMGANIELWTYRLFKNGCLYLGEVFQKSYTAIAGISEEKISSTGKKAALTRKTASYSVEEHFDRKPPTVVEIAQVVQEYMLGLDPAMEQVPKKFYIAYRISQNIVCMEIQKARVLLYLKLDPKKVDAPSEISRDMSEIGHYGTGDLEISLNNLTDFEVAKPFLELAYQKVGG